MGDIGLDETLIGESYYYDLGATSDGDLSVDTEPAVTDIKFIYKLHRGALREFPLQGVGLANYILGETDGLAQDARLMLESDGFVVNAVQAIDNLILHTDAERP